MPIHSSTSHNGAIAVPGLADGGELALTGEQVFSTTGTSNDVALGAGVSVFRLTGASAQTITGFTGGYIGRVLLVTNESSASASLGHLTSSSASNQLALAGSGTLSLNIGGGALLRYDGSKWRSVSFSTYILNSLTLNASNNSTSISGTVNDWAPTLSYRQRIAASAAATITGKATEAGTGGRVNHLQNISAFNITLTHEGTGSTAANRFTCPRSVDLVIPPNGNAYLIYDTTTSRWIVFGDGNTWSQGANTLAGDLIAPPMTSGRYYRLPNCSSVNTSNTLSNGGLRASAVYISSAVTVTRMGAEITAVGDAGSKLRLGIYADDGTGRPGALILDAGTIAADSATVQEITGLSTTIGPGWYWVAAVVQLVTVTQPTVRVAAGYAPPFMDINNSIMPTAGLVAVSFLMTGVTGALPGTFNATGGGSSVIPAIFIKT